MYQDNRGLLSAFRSHGVKYLVVGGFAVIYHAQPRFTRDLDLFVQPDITNSRAVYAALSDLGASLQGLRPEDFADRKSLYRFGQEPRGFDILPSIPGLEFEAAWERRIEAVVDAATGLTANFVSAEDLIAAKLSAGRPQDLADADAVRKALKGRGAIKS